MSAFHMWTKLTRGMKCWVCTGQVQKRVVLGFNLLVLQSEKKSRTGCTETWYLNSYEPVQISEKVKLHSYFSWVLLKVRWWGPWSLSADTGGRVTPGRAAGPPRANTMQHFSLTHPLCYKEASFRLDFLFNGVISATSMSASCPASRTIGVWGLCAASPTDPSAEVKRHRFLCHHLKAPKQLDPDVFFTLELKHSVFKCNFLPYKLNFLWVYAHLKPT